LGPIDAQGSVDINVVQARGGELSLKLDRLFAAGCRQIACDSQPVLAEN